MASATSPSASRHVLPASSVMSAESSKRLGAHQLGGAEEHGRALARRGVAPAGQRRARRGDGRFGLGTAAVGDRADHLVRRRRVHRVERPRRLDVAAADAQRVVRAGPGRGRRPAPRRTPRGSRGARSRRAAGCGTAPGAPRVRRRHHRQPPRLGAEVRRGLRRPHELVDGRSLHERLPQERVVGGVLQQAPHQVGHARDQLADGRVLAHAQAHAADGRLDRVAHAVQHLELEGVRRAGPARAPSRWRPPASGRCGWRTPGARGRGSLQHRPASASRTWRRSRACA